MRVEIGKRLRNNFPGKNYEDIGNGKAKVVTDLQYGGKMYGT